MYKFLNYEYRLIPIDKINAGDDSCRISHKCVSNELKNSIAIYGLLSPITVQPESSGASYKIINGFKRFDAFAGTAADNSSAVINCLVISDISALDGLLINIIDNVSTRELNAIEIAGALHKLSLYSPVTEIIEKYMPLMKMQRSEYIYKRFLSLNSLSQSIKTLIAGSKIPAAAAFILINFSHVQQDIFIKIITDAKMGANLITETAGLLFEISKQYNISISEVYEKIKYKKILTETGSDSNRKTELIRASLHGLKRPMYESALKNFKEFASQFEADKISLNPFPYFEKDEIIVKFNIKSLKDIEKTICALKKIEKSHLINKFIKE